MKTYHFYRISDKILSNFKRISPYTHLIALASLLIPSPAFSEGSVQVSRGNNDPSNPHNQYITNNSSTDTTEISSAIKYQVSPFAGQVIINEVLYAQTGSSANGNDEFIELYNASSSPVNLSNWKLADGNLIANDTDNIGSITGSSSNPAYVFPRGTTLAPGQYAVIWIGNNTPANQATGATFQAWLGQIPKLNNTGDDVWLYDDQLRIVDYMAYGSGSAVNTPPPPELNLWNATHQSSLGGATAGQSISLTPNGIDRNTSACWEQTFSGKAQARCSGYLPTIDTDTVGTRVTSVGQNNNGTRTASPNLLLVKRITAINGVDLIGFEDDGILNNEDNHPYWSDPAVYLRGKIDGGVVRPGDELEYTIYFLSTGGTPATNISLCDLVPTNTTFIPNAFNGLTPLDKGSSPTADRGIALGLDGNSLPTAPTVYLTSLVGDDRGQFFPPGMEPSSSCSGSNENGAVVINVVTSPNSLPYATGQGTPSNSYGFMRFRVRVK